MMPYLSIVVVGRNDNYGGNFLHRIKNFVEVLFWGIQKVRLPTELLVVDWNPPSNEPPLARALNWPTNPKLTIRFITVPPDVHNALPNGDRIPIFDAYASNVGIRRASGLFILKTNPDIILPPSLLGFISARGLSSRWFYRVDRYDVDEEIPHELSPREVVNFCRRRFNRICMPDFVATREHRVASRIASLRQRFLLYLKPRYRVRRLFRPTHIEQRNPRLHLNAPGDFLLMSRRAWATMRGFPERSSFYHLDSLACYEARAAGFKQFNLSPPFRIYHQEHDRSEQSNRPLTNWQEVMEEGEAMLRAKSVSLLNDQDWGLAKLKLEEISSAESPNV